MINLFHFILERTVMSMVYERCTVTGCPHFASRFTYPVCYEHLNVASPPARHPAPSSPNRRKPVAAVSLKAAVPRTTRVEDRGSPLHQQYLESIRDLETRSKTTMASCRTPACPNFGNGKCGGYCHDCHQMLAAIRPWH